MPPDSEALLPGKTGVRTLADGPHPFCPDLAFPPLEHMPQGGDEVGGLVGLLDEP